MTDHAARSRELLNWTDGDSARDLMAAAPVAATIVLGAAQTHATLALAEQQRIANMIAVATWNAEALRRGSRLTLDGEEVVDRAAQAERVESIFRSVREGLGL